MITNSNIRVIYKVAVCNDTLYLNLRACILSANLDHLVSHRSYVSDPDLRKIMESVKQQLNIPISTIYLTTSGEDVLNQVHSWDILSNVFTEIGTHPIQNLILKTKDRSIQPAMLGCIRSIVPNHIQIWVEMELVSSDPDVQSLLLPNAFDNDRFLRAVDEIHYYCHGARVIGDVFVGIPGMSEWDQVHDAVCTIHWAYHHAIDNTRIVSAKSYANIQQMYQYKNSTPISRWEIVRLLAMVPLDMLTGIRLQWYDGRREAPLRQEDCDVLDRFWKQFEDATTGEQRMQLIRECLDNHMKCQTSISK